MNIDDIKHCIEGDAPVTERVTLREKIATQTEEYLANGGEIEQVGTISLSVQESNDRAQMARLSLSRERLKQYKGRNRESVMAGIRAQKLDREQ